MAAKRARRIVVAVCRCGDYCGMLVNGEIHRIPYHLANAPKAKLAAELGETYSGAEVVFERSTCDDCFEYDYDAYSEYDD